MADLRSVMAYKIVRTRFFVLTWSAMCSLATKSHVNFAKNANAIASIACMPSNAKIAWTLLPLYNSTVQNVKTLKRQELRLKTSTEHRPHTCADTIAGARIKPNRNALKERSIRHVRRVRLSWKNWFFCYREANYNEIAKKILVSPCLRGCHFESCIAARVCVRNRLIYYTHISHNFK